jgi:hypothetical protein
VTPPPRLIAGDCLAVLPGLDAASVDVVVTSPPYNLDLRYGTYRDSRGEAEYLDWMVAVATALRRVMKPDASFFLNISGSSSRPWLPFELIVRLRPLFVLQNHITWIKSIAIPGDSVGHYKPVGGGRFLNHAHEHIFHLTLDGDVKLDRLAIGVPFKDKSNIARGACAGPALPGEHLVHSLRDRAEQTGKIPSSWNVPGGPAALVHSPARAAGSGGARSVHGDGDDAGGGGTGGGGGNRDRHRSGLRGHRRSAAGSGASSFPSDSVE